MSNKLTIQINDLSALERLIGGDSEVELDIRQSVVEAFTKKHLKTLANEDTMGRIATALKRDLSSEFVTTVKSGWSNTDILTQKAKDLINNHLDTVVDEKVRGIVREFLERDKISERINTVLEKQVEYIMSELSSDNLTYRLDKMVDQKIKEKLGIK